MVYVSFLIAVLKNTNNIHVNKTENEINNSLPTNVVC